MAHIYKYQYLMSKICWIEMQKQQNTERETERFVVSTSSQKKKNIWKKTYNLT